MRWNLPFWGGRRRKRVNIRRYMPLIAAAVALCLVITGVTVLVRGLTHRAAPSDDASRPAAADLPDTTEAPGNADSTNMPDETPPADDGDDGFGTLATDTPEETPAPAQNVEYGVFTGKRSATIRTAGDIVVHKRIYKSAETTDGYDFTSIFTSIKDSLSSADYTVINVDGPTGGTQVRGYSEYPQFNTPPQILNAIKDAGVDMLTLANNHALDTYYDGLKYTIDNVEAAGLDHVGAYRSQEEYDTPKVIDLNGIKVGITNYTVGTNNLLKSSAPEAAVYGLRMTSNSDVAKDIQALKSAGAEIVVVYMHWGDEYKRTPSDSMQKMAKKIAKAGADVIIGGHPHVVQPCQWLEYTDDAGEKHKTLVAYSLGNFLSDQRTIYQDSGIIFQFTIKDNPDTGKAEVTDPVYVPVYVWRVKGETTYKYKVVAVGAVMQNRPDGMDDDTYKRVTQVASELKEVMSAGVAKASRT